MGNRDAHSKVVRIVHPKMTGDTGVTNQLTRYAIGIKIHCASENANWRRGLF